MLRNTTHPGAFGESVCCKIQCNSINKREISFLFCIYLAGRDTMRTEVGLLYTSEERKKKEDTGLNLAVTDNSIYK